MQKIGKMLKEKRIEQGLSIEDVSEKTRLTVKHVKALEDGDLSFFHEDLSYLRFFVKSYCEVVGLDFEDIKDELRTCIDDYTVTFAENEILSHKEIEKNIANSEKLSKVDTANVKVKKRHKKKPDFSLISLIGIVILVVVVVIFALFMFFTGQKDKENRPSIPTAQESGTKVDEPVKPEQEEIKKEFEIVNDELKKYTLNNVDISKKLKIETTFNATDSGYSVTIDGKDIKNNQIYNYGETAVTEINVKKGTNISIYIGCMTNVEIKINGKIVKTDESFNPEVFPGQCIASTLVFTVGDVYESSK